MSVRADPSPKTVVSEPSMVCCAGETDDLSAKNFGQLDGDGAHATCRTRDDNGVACVQRDGHRINHGLIALGLIPVRRSATPKRSCIREKRIGAGARLVTFSDTPSAATRSESR